MKKPELVGIEPRYKGWCKIVAAKLKLASGEIISREVEDHGNAVCVLPYDPVRRTTIVVKQFRPPMLYDGADGMMIEAIAGLREGDDPVACARREAMEEAGLKLTKLEHVMTGSSMPGISSERMEMYFAPYGAADRVGAGGGLDEEHEDIEVIELPLAELARMADAGELTDVKTMLLLQTLRLRKPELFG